jgi:hypothetical protein
VTSPRPGGAASRPPSALRDGIDPYEHLTEKVSASDRCPHCGGVGKIVPDEELRFVCALCGGPRFNALAPGLAPPAAAEKSLLDAQKARKKRATWRTVSIVSGIATAMMGLVALLFAMISLKAGLIVALFFVLPFVLALLMGMSKAKAAASQIGPAIDSAWAALAARAAHAGRAASPAALAEALGVGESQAEQLHDVLAVDAEIGALGDAERVRIGPGHTEIVEPAPRSQLAPDPRFDALEAKARAAEAEAAAVEVESTEAGLGTAKTLIATPRDGSG